MNKLLAQLGYKCIDYCNLLLMELPRAQLSSVQSVLDAAARMIAHLPQYLLLSIYMINDLHWLPVISRIKHNFLLLIANLIRVYCLNVSMN